MNKLDYKTPYLKYISHKTVTDANGKEHVERVFTLIPVKAKDKPKISKEEVLAARKAKKEAPYVSLGVSKKIPPSIVEKDKDGKIIPKDMWSDMGWNALEEYRRLKEIFDKETTEIITLPNGFKKKIKIKFDFKPLPSMKLSPEERKTRMDEHKKASKAKRTVRNARVAAFNQNPEPYTPESYVSDTKVRKERQAKYWEAHEKKIEAIIEKLRKKGKKKDFKLIPNKTGKVETNGVYKSIPITDKIVEIHTTKRDAIAKAKEMLQIHPEYTGMHIKNESTDLFLSQLNIAA